MDNLLGIKLKRIDSSSIESYGYDPEIETLVLRFHNDRFYVYGQVPEDVVKLLEDKERSVGKTFFQYIKGKYTCVRVS